jgi:hypothetical protein
MTSSAATIRSGNRKGYCRFASDFEETAPAICKAIILTRIEEHLRSAFNTATLSQAD